MRPPFIAVLFLDRALKAAVLIYDSSPTSPLSLQAGSGDGRYQVLFTYVAGGIGCAFSGGGGQGEEENGAGGCFRARASKPLKPT